MPTDQLVLLIVCIALAVIAVLVGVIRWRRTQRPTRLVAGIAWALVPIGLYLSGLADLVWQGIQGLIAWGTAVPGTSTGVAGLIMIGVGLLTAIVVAVIARRQGPQDAAVGRSAAPAPVTGRADSTAAASRPEPAFSTPPASPGSGNPKLPPAMPQDGGGRGRRGRQSAKPSGDTEMDEIEALLKSRGIE